MSPAADEVLDLPLDERAKLAKLPAWARARIEVLQMRLREARAMLNVRAPLDGPHVEVPSYSQQAVTFPIQTDVGFVVGHDGLGLVWWRVSMDPDDALRISYQGSESIAVLPAASNVVRVRALPR